MSSEDPLLITGSYDKFLKFWNINQQRCFAQINFETPVCDIAISPNKQYAAVCGFNSMKVYNTQNQQIYASLAPDKLDYCISSCSFNESGSQLAGAVEDGTVQVYDTRNLQQVAQSYHHNALLNSICYSDNNIIIGEQTGKILLLDQRNVQQPLRVIQAFDYDIGVRWISCSQNKMVACDGRGIIQLYEDFELKCSVQAHSQAVYRVRFAKNGSILASVSSDRTAKTWHVQNSRLIKEDQTPVFEQSAFDVVVSQNGDNVIVGCDKAAKLFGRHQGLREAQKIFSSHMGLVTSLAFQE
ncbi:G beta-like protein GBL [Spironucleus salmonicida]|uniref:G beta-like protein GBL n=1 Tax=Spironucleus salmonicida TaxID=348837 RepID=V6LKU0_9EUKA|nr:G beta-like protein GBL [Spironucleus salmonicida]|eukprot:EST45167.1 G beta-like protein GBL [Spironucleus salmonicida]